MKYEKLIYQVIIGVCTIFLCYLVWGVAYGLANKPKPEELPQQAGYQFDPCGLETIVCESENTINGVIYGYNSIVAQTDSSPFLTASGYRLDSDNVTTVNPIANNCLPFDTIIEIEGIRYTVKDRMNSRYGCEVFDIWYKEYKQSMDFGKQYKLVKIKI